MNFIFTHDFEKEFSIDYEDNNQSLIINNNSYDLVLNFDLNQWLSSIDLSTAVDGNGDGTIEISPNDPDGNNNLANQLNEDLEGSCEIDDYLKIYSKKKYFFNSKKYFFFINN
jgi:hypothetical protein